MALETPEKAPFGAIFQPFLMVFSGFFCELAQEGANWCPCGPEKRWFWVWFKRAVVWVTVCVLVPATILAQSASEGSGYTRLRIGLVCRGCYPRLSQAWF